LNIDSLPELLEEEQTIEPTWYTAVPTMHQAILARAKTYPAIVRKKGTLRFIRSCSAALPPRVIVDFEKLFQVPVIEAYGMTEASHQMASNPLPPLPRKPGLVGLAVGAEVAIMDEQGHLLPAGEKGEVVIRGACVTSGYRNNPEANQRSFTDGWFRTGDQGYLDSDGYLFLTGRIKELINRGGEKIAPREIDEALLEHPAVAQAVAFAMPDDRLGEEVAAAVVLKEDALVTEREIQEYAALRLADFKVPRRVVIVQEIPLVSFFELPTPAGMCRNLIRLQTQFQNGEWALRLKEIAHLSDEEARLILDRELGQKEPQTAGSFLREGGNNND
jgi:acyl-CoA synthetase (AMP-forming)/AMP-acid ligase II